MSRLKKKLAASKNIEELNFQQFCEKTKLSALEFQTVVKGLLKSFFTVNNKAFIDILTNTYKLLLIQNIDLSDEEINQACVETVTLRYLFMLNKLDKESQLKFFNQLLHDINDNFSIQDLDSQLITDLKTYFYTQESILNIESIVLSLVDTIHINDDDINAISAALDELDDSIVQVIGISISAALSQRDINIETSLNNIFKQINVDPQVLNNIKDLIDPTEIITRNVSEQTPQQDIPTEEEGESSGSSMIELFAGNPNVTEINGKYDLSDMRFSELLNYYDDVDQQLAFRAIIPDLFALSTINNVVSPLFKSIYKGTNGLCDTAEDVTKYFLGYKNRGNQILKLFVVATQAEKLVPPTFLHRFLFALDHNVNSLITFADNSTFVKTFSDYLTMSHLRDEYAETVDHLLQDFASKNNLLALYQKAKQELNNPETAISPNEAAPSTLKEEETPSSNNNNESVPDEIGESSDASSSQPDEEEQEEADYSDLDINSIIELVPDENITRTIQVFVESLFNKSNNSKLLKELCTKIYSNAREKNLTVTDETLPVLIKAYPADQIFNLLLSFQNVSEYLPETTFRNIFTMLDEHFATFKCDVKSNLNKTLLQYIIDATSRYEDVVAEKMQQICDNNNILEAYNKAADEYDKSIAKKDEKEPEKDTTSPPQPPIAEEDDPLSEKDLPDWNFLEMSVWMKPGKSGEQAINNFIKSLCTKQNVNKLIEGVCLRLYQLSLQDKKIAENETSLLNSFKTYPVDQILKLLLSFHNINEYLPEKAFISLLTDCGIPMKKCPIQCTLNKTFLQYIIQTTTIYQENIKQIVETICKENDIVKVYNKVVKKQSTKDGKQGNNPTSIKSDNDTPSPKTPRFKHKSSSNPEQQNLQNPSNPPKGVILKEEEEQQPSSAEQQSSVHQIKFSPPVQEDNPPIKVDTTDVDDVTKKLVDDSVTPDVVICDNLTIRDFLNIVNQKYNVPYAKFIHDVTSYTIYALDQLNVINIDSVTKPFNEVLDLYKNDQLKRIVFSSLLKEFSKIPLKITSLDCPFITETLDYIQGDKRYTAYLRTTIDIMCEAYNKKHKSNIVNPFTSDVSKIKNRDLSLEETKQLLTIDQAKDNDDQIKDEVLFNVADFFNHEKIIVLRDDVITSTTASSYQDVLNDYIKDNPDVDMPEAFATGVVANECIFLTSYGKLDKNEVLQAIRRYYPSYFKIYFKEGTRNFTMSTERIAKVNRLFKKI